MCILPIIFDSECAACQEGAVNCCNKGGFIGLSGWGGGLSEHIVVPETSVLKLPDSVSDEIGGWSPCSTGITFSATNSSSPH